MPEVGKVADIMILYVKPGHTPSLIRAMVCKNDFLDSLMAKVGLHNELGSNFKASDKASITSCELKSTKHSSAQ